MKQNQQGIAHPVMLLLFVIVLGAAGFAGWRVVQAGKDKESPVPTTSNSSHENVEELSWAKGGVAIDGKYADADVVQIDSKTWRMYYAVQPEVRPNNFEVFSATSTDGKAWKTDPGTRKTMATFPDVVKLKDGRYRMYYQNAGEIKSAISSDGLSFTDESGTRIDRSNADGFTFDNVAAPSVARLDDGTFVMIYRGTINQQYALNTPNPTTQLLFWATSKDGLSFTKKGIAIDSRNGTLSGQLDGPDIVRWDDESYKVHMTSYTGVFEASFDGEEFSEAKLAFAGDAKKQGDNFMGQPPGDPTLARFGGGWFMFYGSTGESSGIHYAVLGNYY